MPEPRPASDADEVTPDGSPVILYRRLSSGDEPAIIGSVVPPGGRILELGAGAGRVTHPLVAAGYAVVAVDESAAMARWIEGAEVVVARIEGLDLGRRFDAVVLGSHLVNVPEADVRATFLATCRRHLADDGRVLIEHHPVDWALTAAPGRTEVDGIGLALVDVRRSPPFVSAVAVYEVGGATFRQPFTAQVLSSDEMDDELARAGLRVRRHLTDRWIEAVPLVPD